MAVSYTHLAEELGITVCVLFHVSYTLESIINLCVADGINALMANVGESSSLLLLLENTVASLDMAPVGGYKEPISYILGETDAAQVRMCFDLCHYQASKNVLLEEYTFPANWCDRIYQVHFSDTKNNEGYRHIAATHGKACLLYTSDCRADHGRRRVRGGYRCQWFPQGDQR